MITVIRKKLIQNKAYKVVVWAVVVVCAVSIGGPGLFGPSASSTSIATVNGNDLSYNDFSRKVVDQENRLHIIRKQYGQYADMLMQAMGMSSDPAQLAREALIRDELINQAVRSVGLRVHPHVVQERIGNAEFVYEHLSDLVPPYLINPMYGIDMQGLRSHLQRFQYTISDFHTKVAEAIERLTMRDIVSVAAYVPGFELHEQAVHDFASKKFSILTLSLDDFVRKEQEKGIGQDELTAFYNTHAQLYRIPEKRSAVVWKLDPAHYGVAITEEAIKTYYDENKSKEFVDKPALVQVRRILLKAEKESDFAAVHEKAQKLLAELRQNPALFGQKAQELSQDKESASKGGLIPAFARGSKDKTFERAAFLLKQDGDISEVIQSNQGFELLQRVSKSQPTYKPLAAVVPVIRTALTQQQFAGMFGQDVQEFSNNEAAWQKFVADKHAKMNEHGMSTQDASKLSEQLFAMKVGEYQSFVDGNVGIAMRMTGLQKSTIPSLEAIKSQVEKGFLQERAAVSMKERLNEIRSRASTQSFEELSKSYGVPLERTPLVAKADSAAVANLRSKKLPIEAMLIMEKVGLVMVQGNDKKGFIVRLDEIAPVDTVVQEKQGELKDSLTQENSRMVPATFVASLYRNATIKHNDSLPNTQKEYSI